MSGSSTRLKTKRMRPEWNTFSWKSGLIAGISFDFGLAATCCFNSTSGLPFDSCTCLADNTQKTGQIVARGESALYHWVLEGSNTELIANSPRGNLTFKLSPCSGSVRMDIKPSSPSSWSFMPTFTSQEDWNPSALTISVKASEYTVFVTAGTHTNSSTFDIATYNSLHDTPSPGGGGALTATMPTTTTAAVTFNTSETPSLGNSSYRLYWTSLSTWAQEEGEEVPRSCVIPSDGLSFMDNPNCLFSSACGMDRTAEGKSDWVALSHVTEHSFEAPITSGIRYLFNVAMRDTNNITSTYRASNMTFFFKTHEQCVADPDCESQVHKDSTIVIVCSLVLAVLAMLVGSTKAIRYGMQHTMEFAASLTFRLAFGALCTPPPHLSPRVADKYRSITSAISSEAARPHAYGDNTVVNGGVDQNEDKTRWRDRRESGLSPKSRRTSTTRLMKSPPTSPEVVSRRRSTMNGRRGSTVANGGGGNRDEDESSWRDPNEENGPSPRSRRTSTRLVKSPPASPDTASRRDGRRGRGGSIVVNGGGNRDEDDLNWRDPNEENGPSPRSRRTSTTRLMKSPPASPETASRRDRGRRKRGSTVVNGGGGNREEDESSWRDHDEENGPSPRRRRTSTMMKSPPASPETPSRRRATRSVAAAGGGRYQTESGRAWGLEEEEERQQEEQEVSERSPRARRNRRMSIKVFNDMKRPKEINRRLTPSSQEGRR